MMTSQFLGLCGSESDTSLTLGLLLPFSVPFWKGSILDIPAITPLAEDVFALR